jgi:hypothetical protein
MRKLIKISLCAVSLIFITSCFVKLPKDDLHVEIKEAIVRTKMAERFFNESPEMHFCYTDSKNALIENFDQLLDECLFYVMVDMPDDIPIGDSKAITEETAGCAFDLYLFRHKDIFLMDSLTIDQKKKCLEIEDRTAMTEFSRWKEHF